MPGVGWGGGMGRDESALMFCKILPSSSILSCFLCLYLFLTGGERMFSLKKSFLELQKSYKVSCGKLTFRLKSGHILFASSLKLWSSSMLPEVLFLPWAPLSSSARQGAQKLWVLLLTHARRESSCLQESWAAAVGLSLVPDTAVALTPGGLGAVPACVLTYFCTAWCWIVDPLWHSFARASQVRVHSFRTAVRREQAGALTSWA